MKKKIALAFATLPLLAFTTACEATYTFEAVPVGVDDDDAEQGIEGDPARFDCFTIEADHSVDDEEDVQLGTFCKKGSE